MNCWLIPSLILLFAWRICNLQDASASVQVVRASKHFSEFISHASREADTVTQDPSDSVLSLNHTLNNAGKSLVVKQPRVRRFDDDFEEITTETTTEAMYSEEFYNCSDSLVSVKKGEYDKLPNGSVYISIYGRLFTPKNYGENDKGEVYVCSEFFGEEDDDRPPKFHEALGWVSLGGIVVSSVCILAHIFMFLWLEKLRNLPGYSLFSMCIALLVAYICSVAHFFREETAECTGLGIVKAYCFLASFFWMNAMSFDIWRSLRLATAKLRLTSQQPMEVRFAMYSAYSWGIPLIIITIGLIIKNIPGTPELYRLVISEDMCWFKHKPALGVYFAFPLFALLVLNLLLFVSSFFMINSATMSTAESRADLWPRFLVCMRLAVVMGLMWIFGVLATTFQQGWLWYFYVVCNVLQGVFIFFSFTLTEKTRKEWRKAVASKKSSVFRTLTTLQSSSSV